MRCTLASSRRFSVLENDKEKRQELHILQGLMILDEMIQRPNEDVRLQFMLLAVSKWHAFSIISHTNRVLEAPNVKAQQSRAVFLAPGTLIDSVTPRNRAESEVPGCVCKRQRTLSP